MSEPKPDPAPPPQELRRWERHSASMSVEVNVFLNGERSNFRGKANDISRGGMRLLLTRELEPGTSLLLAFLIPYQAIKFNLCGVVRNRSGFNHGIEFINASPHQEEMIERTCQILKLLQ